MKKSGIRLYYIRWIGLDGGRGVLVTVGTVGTVGIGMIVGFVTMGGDCVIVAVVVTVIVGSVVIGVGIGTGTVVPARTILTTVFNKG